MPAYYWIQQLMDSLAAYGPENRPEFVRRLKNGGMILRRLVSRHS